jgi:hypothetical protein
MSTEKPQQQAGGLSVPVDAQQLAVVHEFRDVYQQWQASDSSSEQSDALGKRVEHLQMRLAFILDALVEQAEKAAAKK